ncbi:MAG: glycosyltransferase family 9 protein [Paludibacteraceae bacterium]|nr:glycosyltransferase family 9 protein [Paludibacteraceae bacterium]
MRTFLIIRLETLGNVAMTVPVIASLSRRYPDDRFVVVAKKDLHDMFYGLKNVEYVQADYRQRLDLVRLMHQLRRLNIREVIDLQDRLNTRVLRLYLRMHGAHIHAVHYGRWHKRWLTFVGAKYHDALPTEFDRYRDVFLRAGLETDTEFEALAVNRTARTRVNELYGERKGQWIGVAPFAKSASNMLPYRVTKQLILRLAERPNTRIFLFGAGEVECEMLSQWAGLHKQVESVAGRLRLGEELELMRQLDYMICMDSANQHLSSLVGLRAVSIWCGTHPKLGFMGWKQRPEDIIQHNELACRPCTMHGTNHCRFLNYACKQITAKQIIQHIYE